MTQILKTRLYKPIVKPHYVFRGAIIEYLDKHADNPLTLVIAPAGYGKSVTTSQWIDHKGYKYGWISLDEDCNDLRVLLSYLVNCVQITYPESLDAIHDLSNAIELPPANVIANILVNEINDLEEEFVLVLDDYHFIHNQQVHTLLGEILKFPSERLKLFLLSRKDPPLMLSTLKAYDHVSELRMSELRFDEKEVIDLTYKISAKTFSHETAMGLVNVTEGWIIGLKLAIQSINKGRDPKLVLSDMANEKQTIAKFLMNEILYPQSQNVRECLFKLSIFSRFCEGLLSAVCENDEFQEGHLNSSGKDFFDELTKKTLFIIPLDSEQTWFRFHHIFSEILQKQLEKRFTPEEISELHVKASRWFESNGYIDDALKHALNAGDIEFANKTIEKNFIEQIDNENLPLLDRWLRMMPAEANDIYFTPNLIHAFLCESKHDMAGMEKALNRAVKLLPPLSVTDNNNRINWGYFYTLQSMLFYLTGRNGQSLISSTRALELLDSENGFLKDLALAYYSIALISSGKSNEADEKVSAYLNLVHPENQKGLARNSIIISMISFLSGDLNRIHKTLYPFVDFYKGKSYLTTRVVFNNYLGTVYYQWNQLDEAIPLLDESWTHRFSGRPFWVIQNLFLKFLVHHAKGEESELNQLFEQAYEYVESIKLPVLNQYLASMQVEMALLGNAYEQARKFYQKAASDHIIPIWYYYIPQLTLIKFRFFERGQENIEKVEKELNDLIELGKKANNRNVLIQAFSFKAMMLKQLGNIDEALITLSEALTIAKPGGFMRVFMDTGEEMRDLLLLHKNREADDHYVNRILKAFTMGQSKRKYEFPAKEIITNDISMVKKENLSSKELEILKLASTGLQNKEIAEKLFLSPNSVKKYLYYAYRKLEVKNRTNAISLAKQMNLI